METDILASLSACREALVRNPDDLEAMLNASGLLRELGHHAQADELLAHHHRAQAAAGADRAGASGWQPGDRPPERFEEISDRLDSVTGWLLKDQEKFLFDKVKSLPDGAVIVEMGCWKGKSTAAMAFACLGTRKHVYSIDTFSGNEGAMGKTTDLQPAWSENLRRFGLEGYATPLRGYTFAVLPDRAKYPAPDFAFIDASHEFTDVLEDFRTIYPYVKDGGWIGFHDVELGWPGPWRVWRDYARDLLSDHQYSATLACGRKQAGRPFRRRPSGEIGFPFARVLAEEYVERLGASHDLVRALQTSLAGHEGVPAAEKRIAEAPEQELHAVLNDMMVAVDGRVDGHLRLWHGLSLMGQGKAEEAAGHFRAATRVSSPLPEERVSAYLAKAGGAAAGPARAGSFHAEVRPGDTVIAIGGDGALLAEIACARKAAVEADRDLRKRSITEFGIDSLEAWDDLPDGCADLIVSDGGLERAEAPLDALRCARAKLRPGGKAVILTGGARHGEDPARRRPALYSWNAETLGNLFRAAGFKVLSAGPTESGGARLKLVAAKA